MSQGGDGEYNRRPAISSVKQGIALVVAMTGDYVIGISNQLPWRLSADLKRFRALTLNGCVVMGRRTFESIGRPLPDRSNIVVTRRGMQHSGDIRTANSLEAAIEFCRSTNKPTFVIGGGELYERALPLASRIHLTLIETHEMKLPLFDPFRGDAYFPRISPVEWAVLRLGRKNVARPKGRPAPVALRSIYFRFIDLVRIGEPSSIATPASLSPTFDLTKFHRVKAPPPTNQANKLQVSK